MTIIKNDMLIPDTPLDKSDSFSATFQVLILTDHIISYPTI